MYRRKFLQFLGAGAAVSAAGVFMPSARRFFLPPTGGWSTKDRLVIRKCSQIGFRNGEVDYTLFTRYDAVWTRPDGSEYMNTLQFDDARAAECGDSMVRSMLERKMRDESGAPGGRYFKLDLPPDRIARARYI